MKIIVNIFLAFIVLFTVPIYGQNTFTLNGTVEDTDNVSWINATWNATLNYTGVGNPVYINGTKVPLTFVGTTDSSGNLVGTLGNSSQIIPPNTTWTFTVCPLATSPCYSFQPRAYNSGAIGRLTPPGLRIVASTLSYAYNQIELISPQSGNSYINTTSATQFLWNGSWTQISGGGGAGTYVLLNPPALAAQTINGNINIAGDSNPGAQLTITCSSIYGCGSAIGTPSTNYAFYMQAYTTVGGCPNPYCGMLGIGGTSQPPNAHQNPIILDSSHNVYFPYLSNAGTNGYCYYQVNSAGLIGEQPCGGGLTSFQGRSTAAATLQESDIVSILDTGSYNLTTSACGSNGSGSFDYSGAVDGFINCDQQISEMGPGILGFYDSLGNENAEVNGNSGTVTNLQLAGPPTYPSGTCPVSGSVTFSQDGLYTWCNSSTNVSQLMYNQIIGSNPTVTPGPALGTGGSVGVSFVAGSHNTAGRIAMTAGTTGIGASGALFTVVFYGTPLTPIQVCTVFDTKDNAVSSTAGNITNMSTVQMSNGIAGVSPSTGWVLESTTSPVIAGDVYEIGYICQ